jgi:fructose-specific component phosphotransferase system IIB-like protein
MIDLGPRPLVNKRRGLKRYWGSSPSILCTNQAHQARVLAISVSMDLYLQGKQVWSMLMHRAVHAQGSTCTAAVQAGQYCSTEQRAADKSCLAP